MKTLNDFVAQIIRASLEESPDDMLGDFLDIVITLSEAADGSVIGEYGPHLCVLLHGSARTNTENEYLPWESAAGRALKSGKIMYTPASLVSAEDTGHANSEQKHLLTMPIPSVYHDSNAATSGRFTHALQLGFDQPVFPATPGDGSAPRQEFTFEEIETEDWFEHHLASIFVLLPVLSFGMETKKLRRTAYQAMHELKNKFFSINAWLRCLDEDLQACAPEALNNGDVKESLHWIKTVSDEGVNLSKSSLMFTQIYTRHFKTVDVRDVVQRAATDIKALASSMGEIDVDVHVDENVGNRYLDPDQLRIALFNIGKNALEALLHSGVNNPCFTINMKAREDHRIEIVLTDNNGGLPDEIRDALFIPFTTNKDGGAGLGLAITKKIIDDHNGAIDCQSDNNGTCFTIVL